MARLSTSALAFALCASSASGRVGDAWGTNIHWTSGAPGEAAMLARAYKVARMDLGWASIEKAGACGTYDYSAYDALLAEMEENGVRPYWILDYNNDNCYPSPGSSCTTAACIEGYGKFGAATVEHFKGRNIIFESVNEANGMGQDNASDITAMCAAAGPHFLQAGEVFVGPTTAGIDFAYLNSTFEDGILAYLSGVSVHPYRSGPPESAAAELRQLSAIIKQYVPAGMPILSGEWGYTSALPPCTYGNRVSQTDQGKFVPRMWFAALLGGASTMISYDWKDDGSDPTNCEDNFGSVVQSGSTFTPKPSYLAALAAQTGVGNASSFDGRVSANFVGAPPTWGLTPDSAFVLAFSGGELQGPAFAVYTNVTTCMLAPVAGARSSCGAAGVDEMGCIALGCCFDELLPANATDVPRCYVAAQPPQTPGKECPASERSDCGYDGIGHDECVTTRGCCWDDSPHPAGPQCFFSADGRAGGPLNISFSVAPAAADACFGLVDTFGFARGQACASGGAITVEATDGPLYLF